MSSSHCSISGSERSVDEVKAACAHTFAPPEEGSEGTVLQILRTLADS